MDVLGLDMALHEPRWDVVDVFADSLLCPSFAMMDEEDHCEVRFDLPTPPASFDSPPPFPEEFASSPLLDLASLTKSVSLSSLGSVDFSYATPLATPAQSVPSSPQMSPRCTPAPEASAECIEPAKLLAGEAAEDSDAEIDVVTVDDETRAARMPSLAGLKRAWTDPHVALAPAKVPLVQKPAPESGAKKAKVAAATATPTATVTAPSSPSSGDESGNKTLDVETRRHVHNVLERRRREDLKASFDGLRAAVPDLEPNDKSPKVAILTGATEHIVKLKRRQQELLVAKDVLTTEQLRLVARLGQLQAQLNALNL